MAKVKVRDALDMSAARSFWPFSRGAMRRPADGQAFECYDAGAACTLPGSSRRALHRIELAPLLQQPCGNVAVHEAATGWVHRGPGSRSFVVSLCSRLHPSNEPNLQNLNLHLDVLAYAGKAGPFTARRWTLQDLRRRHCALIPGSRRVSAWLSLVHVAGQGRPGRKRLWPVANHSLRVAVDCAVLIQCSASGLGILHGICGASSQDDKGPGCCASHLCT